MERFLKHKGELNSFKSSDGSKQELRVVEMQAVGEKEQ